MRKVQFFIIIITLFLVFKTPVFAKSSYVLPYPSRMPGSVYYNTHLFLEQVLKYWYVGNFSQFEYNRKYSDKYLVEAKTLFEYSQYLLAYDALEKSNEYFEKADYFLVAAGIEGKNISEKKLLFKKCAQKHDEILTALLTQTPEEFMWKPEVGEASNLKIHQLIRKSIKDRKERYE